MHRILIVNWRDIKDPEAGGAEVHLHEISKRFVTRGHKVTHLTSAFRGAPAEEEIDGIRVVRCGGKFTFNFCVPGAIKRLLRSEPFDIVVDDINKIPFFTPVYVKRPLLALAHHLFAQTIFLETLLPFALYVYAGELLIPTVYKRTRFVVVSESTRDDLVRRGIPRDNIEIVYNAVDHVRYTPVESSLSPVPLVGYVGRIKRYKRVDHLLEALAIVAKTIPDVRLALAGSGDYLPSLVTQAGKLGISDRVDFMGSVSEQEKIDMLRKSHVVVNPSSKEGWGVTVIEANACGAPVIASDVPGLRDAVVDGETGFLVPYGDIDGFAARIKQVLSNHSLRTTLSRQAIDWAKRFNWDDSADAILKVIDQLVQKA
ncbi:MAG: glycosyltransferase family 4 protein [Candidatus Eisenbacteria bacterium]